MALFIVLLGRLVASRKLTRALESNANEGLVEPLLPSLGAPRAVHRESPLCAPEPSGGEPKSVRVREERGTGLPVPIEAQPTRRFVRITEPPAQDNAEMTIRCERVYLDADDLLEY
ncbi:hypothetical protein [Enhygromyxa salina]|uniref:hypothetical protein n=1 Tax=Enhygromyxa salina TaxID=215803 RepID=UPI000D08692C|nr:hypothetical protein [Enhygromyxa salina]